MQEFFNISRFPQVLGALDGSHIPIKAPKDDPNEYVNRKSFHSIVLQGVVDANGKFLHVSTGYAGSIHDARVLRMSALLTAIENAPHPCFDASVVITMSGLGGEIFFSDC